MESTNIYLVSTLCTDPAFMVFKIGDEGFLSLPEKISPPKENCPLFALSLEE